MRRLTGEEMRDGVIEAEANEQLRREFAERPRQEEIKADGMVRDAFGHHASDVGIGVGQVHEAFVAVNEGRARPATALERTDQSTAMGRSAARFKMRRDWDPPLEENRDGRQAPGDRTDGGQRR